MLYYITLYYIIYIILLDCVILYYVTLYYAMNYMTILCYIYIFYDMALALRRPR